MQHTEGSTVSEPGREMNPWSSSLLDKWLGLVFLGLTVVLGIADLAIYLD
jgi:hypothetical protein